MNLYFLNPDFSLMPKKLKFSFDSGRCWNPSWNVVDGIYPAYTPPINCDTCRFMPNIGEPIPNIDPLKLDIQLPGSPVSPEEFQSRVVTPLAPFYPMGFPVQSGQALGPLKGKLRGEALDFIAIFGEGIRLVQSSSWARLEQSGINGVTVVAARIKDRNRDKLSILELQAQSLVRLATDSKLKQPLRFCKRCGRNNIAELRAEWVHIQRSSITMEHDVFGLWEDSRGLIVSERFKNKVLQAGLQGALFTPVPISDE